MSLDNVELKFQDGKKSEPILVDGKKWSNGKVVAEAKPVKVKKSKKLTQIKKFIKRIEW